MPGTPQEHIDQLLALDPGLTEPGRVDAAVVAYLEIIADELERLDLTCNEWCAILDLHNGVGVGGALGGPLPPRHYIEAEIAESLELDEKWQVDTAALAQRLHEMPLASRIAIIEACGRFWARSNMPTDEAMKAAGIMLATESCDEA